MEKLNTLTGIAAPLDRANVDTDAIIPKQFLKSISRTGFGPYCFDEWRYEDQGVLGMDCSQRPLNTTFSLNQSQYQGAQFLLTRQNFGCGSSREHAVWALKEMGFRVIIAPSFAEIFFSNCFKNGVLPIILPEAQMDVLFQEAESTKGLTLTLNLEAQTLENTSGETFSFEIDEARKHALLEGLDEIGTTLKFADDIQNFESNRPTFFALDNS